MKRSDRAKKAEDRDGLIPENKLNLYFSELEVALIVTVCRKKERHHYQKNKKWDLVAFYSPEDIENCLKHAKNMGLIKTKESK